MHFLTSLLTSIMLFFGSLFGFSHSALTPAVPAVQTVASTTHFTNQLSQQGADTVLFMRNDKAYEMDIVTKELKPYISPIDAIKTFSGLPKEMDTNKVFVSMSDVLLSADKTKAIVVFSTFDNTKEPSAFDGSLPLIRADEFMCDIASRECSPTNVLALAYEASGRTAEWFRDNTLSWYEWDSKRNLLFGHVSGEGIGSASPVYVFNANTKILQQTVGYDSLNNKEKRAEVPWGAFSPSLSKFVMVQETGDTTNARNTWKLLLYRSDNLTVPQGVYDISAMNDASHGFNRVGSVAWSTDEETLVILTNDQLFTLNFESGEKTLRYTDTSKDASGLWLDFNHVRLSQDGRFITFVDYIPRVDGDNLNPVLVSVDLSNNNKVTELLHDEYLNLSLPYQF